MKELSTGLKNTLKAADNKTSSPVEPSSSSIKSDGIVSTTTRLSRPLNESDIQAAAYFLRRLPSFKTTHEKVVSEEYPNGAYTERKALERDLTDDEASHLQNLCSIVSKEHAIKYITILSLRKPVSFSMGEEERILFIESLYDDIKDFCEYAVAKACSDLRKSPCRYFPEGELMEKIRTTQGQMDVETKKIKNEKRC